MATTTTTFIRHAYQPQVATAVDIMANGPGEDTISDFPTVVEKVVDQRARYSNLLLSEEEAEEGDEAGGAISDGEPMVELVQPARRSQRSGSFCTEVRNLHLAATSTEGVPSRQDDPDVDLESISEYSDNSDDEPRPPEKKPAETPKTESSNSRAAGDVDAINNGGSGGVGLMSKGDRERLAALAETMTLEDVERRVEEFEVCFNFILEFIKSCVI